MKDTSNGGGSKRVVLQGLKNKMASYGLKRWRFKMASSLARFGLSTYSSVCCEDGKLPGTPNALTF